MGLLFDDGRDKAIKAARAADDAHKDLDEAADLLKDVSRKLRRVADELPKGTSASVTKSIFRTMRNVERGARQMLTHMKKLDTHVRHMESALRNRGK